MSDEKKKTGYRRHLKFKELTVDDLERAADLIDGGRVSMYREGSRFRIYVGVRSEDKADIDFLFDLFKGYYREQLKDGKTWYWLNMQQHRGYEVLKAVHPWLIERRRHAEIIFELKAIVAARKPYQKLTEEDIAARQRLIDEIRGLNKAIGTALKEDQESQESSE